MSYTNKPLKTIGALLTGISGYDSMPWEDPARYPVPPGAPAPIPQPKDYMWTATFTVTPQYHSSRLSRAPGTYTGMDITVGQWVANTISGQAWQITKITEKTDTSVVLVLHDVYRYNTFRDINGVGGAEPPLGKYIIFDLSDSGIPQIDPVPETGVSPQFSQNLNSRFEYNNLQYDYPLYQAGNSFKVGDVIAADDIQHRFVLADEVYRIVIGRVTSISDVKPGWFTIDPVQKVVDFLDYLPGQVGDMIYTDGEQLTVDKIGPQVYVKLRDYTVSEVASKNTGNVIAGNVFQVNGVNVTVTGVGSTADLVYNINQVSAETGVSAAQIAAPNTVYTGAINNMYGEPALFAALNPATAYINGVPVVFNEASEDPGYMGYARIKQMVSVINKANIPNVTAQQHGLISMSITNSTGGAIDITNQTPDSNGLLFAGDNSATCLPLHVPATTQSILKLTAVDSRPINLLDVSGTPTRTLGLVSVENGVKAAGLYVKDGLRSASTTVVSDKSQLSALQPMSGDSAFVINSGDESGNNAGEWSLWIFDGRQWVQTSNQDSATTDAKSLEYTLAYNDEASVDIGEISTGRRVALITVEVTEAFNTAASLSVGYRIINNNDPEASADGLMQSAVIDLTTPGIYTSSSSVLFGTDTASGDVMITCTYVSNNASAGTAQIIVTYV